MSLQPGTRLGVYEIQSALGAGGMGEVYRARDSKLGRDVAIKVGTPKKLFDARYFSANQARSYDVSPDGQRFLFIKDAALEASDPHATPASIVVTLNWFTELEKQRPK